MIGEHEVVRRVEGLTIKELRYCVARGWLSPTHGQEGDAYVEIDIARVRFIRELRDDIGIDEDAIPVLLSLLDRVHSLRRELRLIAEAVADLPEESRARIAELIQTRRADTGPDIG